MTKLVGATAFARFCQLATIATQVNEWKAHSKRKLFSTASQENKRARHHE